MRTAVLVGLLASVTGTRAQAGAYAQCGGNGWKGETTCVSGFYCSFGNEWYSQCVPGTAPASSTTTKPATTSTLVTSTVKSSSTSKATSTTKPPTTTLVTSTSKTSSSIPSSTAGACKTAFTPISAKTYFTNMNPGWNLGNTLDAIPDEGSWNNPVAAPEIFPRVKAQGFKSIRIPVTWADHFATGSPTWNVVPAWMDRVETVVDQALAAGFYVILNVHHDSWNWANPTVAGANYTAIQEQFGRLWTQIGTRFACKSEKLLFEPLNEPSGTTQEHADLLNKLDDIFLDVINKAGGYNPQRVVSLSGLGQDSVKTSQWFKRGTTYPNQPWGLQFHYYSPYDFIFGAWGKTIWGSDDDKALLLNDFALFAGNFSGIPTFIGEWSASPAHTEPAARWKYVDYLVRTANKFGFSTVMWDNGNDNYDRIANKWRDPVSVTATVAAAAGISNSLADSTTDPAATTQVSSARIFHKVGDAVTAQSVSYLLNGNTISKITNAAGTTLSSSQYTVSGGTVTFSSAYLATLYSATAAAGVKDTLTVTFSAGTPLTLEIVQYTTPVIATKSWSFSSLDVTKDLDIPITYNGVPEIAAIKAIKADGTYLSDDWTVYLGPLQQARWTYGNWEYTGSGLTIYASGLSVIKAAGQAVTLTVEFFPRSLGSQNVTLTFTP